MAPGRRADLPAAGTATVAAPAKINLTLEVVGLRSDGYHALRSVFAPLELADRLDAVRLAPGERDQLTVLGVPAEDLGPADRNLVLRAAAAFRAEVARTVPPLAFTLEKRIPVAAGLGGGSSDAVAALRLAAVASGRRLGTRRCRRLAAALGSDVPFFALGGWALVGGRGERLARLPAPPTVGVLLVTPAVRVSAAEAYAAWDAGAETGHSVRSGRRGRASSPALALARRLRAGATAGDLAALEPVNDLWAGVAELVPGLASLRAGLAALLDRPVHLSGSGPTLFALFGAPGEAAAAADTVQWTLTCGALLAPGDGPARVIATRTVDARQSPGGPGVS